jgi:DNA-binding response OmpR family regulator
MTGMPLHPLPDQDDTGAAEIQPVRALRVVVVEDDPVIAHLIDHVLRRQGFAVAIACDGRRAQQMLAEPPPAVVVLDVMLPFVGGFELMTWIRGTPQWARVPVLMLTAKANENYLVRAFGAGVSDYMTKPFRPEELVARVRRLALG